jgi:hypothetical protein
MGSLISPTAADFRRAAELVRAHAAGNMLAVQAALARKGELPGVALALTCLARAGVSPVLGAAGQLEDAADRLEFMEWKRQGGAG